MKLTKSYAEINKQNIEFMNKWHGKRRKVFLWRVTRMADGSLGWLQWAWIDYGIEWDSYKAHLFTCPPKYFYEDLK
jgi:hypothetical protein